MAKFKWDFLNLGLISLFSPLYFYKLGQSSLSSWDEAWYGDIARNILETGNFLTLSWNGAIFSDHPPAGFWIINLRRIKELRPHMNMSFLSNLHPHPAYKIKPASCAAESSLSASTEITQDQQNNS